MTIPSEDTRQGHQHSGSEQVQDGGPAFPFVQWRSPDGMYGIEQSAGMSLRDWFAAQAMTGILASESGFRGRSTKGDLASTSYTIADAMLLARHSRTDDRMEGE